MYSPASWDVTDSRVPEVALVRSSSWMLVRRELLPPPLSWKRTALPKSKENSGTADVRRRQKVSLQPVSVF